MSEELEGRRSAERIVEVLAAQGVKTVFGVPGAKIDQLFDALLDSDIDVVACRHEQNAAFMAAAVGRLTGTPGVTIATSGPGVTNLATGLLTATAEGDPMVALCGAVPRADRLKHTHQSLDAAVFLSAVTKSTGEVNAGDNVAATVANAFRRAEAMPRGATAVVLPSDVLAEKTTRSITSTLVDPEMGPAPRPAIEKAAEAIKAARFPVILAGMRMACNEGTQALHELLSAADLQVVETFQAAGVIGRDLEDHFLGRVGLFRNQPGDIALHKADLVLTIGYDQIEYDAHLWNTDNARQIISLDEINEDIDDAFQPSLELRGDIPATMRELASALKGYQMTDEARAIAEGLRTQLAEVELPVGSEAKGLDPLFVVQTLRSCLSDDTVVTCDIGSHQIYMARYFRTYQPRTLLFSNGQQTLGVGLPWGIAASLVDPSKPVVSVSGDGGFLFSAMELETAVRLKSNLVHVVFNDTTYDMVAFQQQMKYGRTCSIQLGEYDVAAYAESFGAHGHTVTNPDELAATIKAALEEEGPSVINVPVDYSNNATYLAHQLRTELLS
ncbi:acetolactate synthase AlsS [Micrococcus sp.]|uniref:acetolactate synthase AlsS n=1 Tax=Micrococcus sp. TaxID=1271 RepID=UPI002A911A29|nr:acetolactate synthase AlsS [Micrococcus sp.]MDY6054706.1 acetolactate synthase AlsS [Micrococcus sp.]